MKNNHKSIICIFLLLLIQTFLIFTIYNIMPDFTTSLDRIYQHPAWVWLVFASLILYFIPSFTAITLNNKYSLQITITNAFLGFSIIGWVATLIWATIKPSAKEKPNFLICNILIQIFSFIVLTSFCIIDHNLYNYQKMDEIYKQNLHETMDAINTINEYYQKTGVN